jgi:putative oxidoreductase
MLSILRIVAGLIYLSVGTMKLFGFPPPPPGMPPFGLTSLLGISAILYCFLYLYLVFAGAGPWSIDAIIARSKGSNPY